jgi:hypothetical protein
MGGDVKEKVPKETSDRPNTPLTTSMKENVRIIAGDPVGWKTQEEKLR